MVRWLLTRGAYTAFLKVVAMGVTLLFVALLSNWMPKADYGVLALILSVAALAGAVGGFGQSDLVIREVAPLVSAGRVEDARNYLSQAVLISLVVSLPVALMVGAYFLLADHGVGVAFAAIVLVTAWSLGYPLQGGARSWGRYLLALGPRDIFWRVGVLLVCGILVYLDQPTTITVIAPVAAVVLTIAVVVQLFALRVTLLRKPDDYSSAFNKTRLMASGALMLSLLTIQAQNNVDTFFVGSVISVEAAAEYYPVNRLSLVAGFFFLPVQMLIAPRMATMISEGNLGQLKRLNSFATLLLAVITLVVSATLLFAFPWFRGYFGTLSSETHVILAILLLAPVLNSALGLPDVPLIMSGRLKKLVTWNVVTLIVGSLSLYLAAASSSLVAVASVASGAIVLRKLGAAVLAWFALGIKPIHFELLSPKISS